MAIRRIMKELQDIERDPIPGVSVSCGEDVTVWSVVLEGPAGTPYEGGLFCGNLRFPPDYPFKPFKFALTTKIYSTHVHGG